MDESMIRIVCASLAAVLIGLSVLRQDRRINPLAGGLTGKSATCLQRTLSVA
jgi:hypothetical protein